MFDYILRRSTHLKDALLPGLTVTLVLVPEAVAFSFVAGVEPLVGLYATFMVGLITAAIGGRPGMISGATGALAVVVIQLVAEHGIQYLFATVVLMGIIQIGAGVAKMGKFVRLIPHPVMLGFVNGLAIIIFLAQLSNFKDRQTGGWVTGERLYLMLGLVALTMAIIHFLPKLTKAVPASLAAILVVTGLVHGLNLDTRTVGDLAQVAGGLPDFNIPDVPWNLETLKIILPYAVILAAVGLIESLMTLSLIDEITETRGRGNKECIGQGVANVVTGFFGGMGGCAMIGQSMININSGGRGRASGILAALFLLVFILFASSLIEMIPLTALVGVMFMVVIGTFAWPSILLIPKIPKSDAFVLILVSGVTVVTDLAVAVGVGVIVSALVFAWKQAQKIWVRTEIDVKGVKIYKLSGPLFFGSVRSFHDLFTPNEDPIEVVIDFQDSRVYDHSGLEAINALTERYLGLGKFLRLKHLSPECAQLLENAGSMVDFNLVEDPRYHISTDRLA
ncbi:MAG: SulP family inorganic anion transporter [bacterium]|nr:SulP family inorganic anion transporter [bacterium]